MDAHKTREYINDFLFFVLKPHGTGYIYCSGINIDRFLPITRGRHRPMSNPAIRGLQLLNLGVRALALSRGAVPRATRENLCSGIIPATGSWSTERLLIENAPGTLPGEIITYCVTNYLRKVYKAICLPQDGLPDTLLEPDELQKFIESQCGKYGP